MRATLMSVLLLWSLLAQGFEMVLTDQTAMEVERIAPAQAPKARLVWLPSEYGLLEQERALARQLARQGVESWLPQLFEAYFLSPSPSAVKKVPDGAVVELFERARSDGVPVYLVGTDRGAVLALKAWIGAQKRAPVRHGAIVLINPNLYVATPQPGAEATYWPETERLNAPVYLFQAELSPWRWRLAELVEKLERGGSDVFVHLLPKVRDRFYFRPDAMVAEKRAAARFAGQILRAMALLTSWMETPRELPQSVQAPAQSAEPVKSGKRATLVAYEGPQYPPLKLATLDGAELDMRDLRGKVVLVNFWASWCPPCVHEMPSMAALKAAMKGRDFEILAINLAEEKPAIEAFVKEHPVNFPILLDPAGTAVKSWRVFAYPSSYLLDRAGRIRYAAFGALDWNGPEARSLIERLLAE